MNNSRLAAFAVSSLGFTDNTPSPDLYTGRGEKHGSGLPLDSYSIIAHHRGLQFRVPLFRLVRFLPERNRFRFQVAVG